MAKRENLWIKNIDKDTSIVSSVRNGTRAIVTVVATGLAIGLGFKAFGSNSSTSKWNYLQKSSYPKFFISLR